MKATAANHPADHWLQPWHVDPSINKNYDFVDGLRGLAILMVLACHVYHMREPEHTAGQFVFNFFGTLGRGVDLFFTLSGFLISWPFWKRKAALAATPIPSGYGWRRFWKIYPPLALSVVLLTPLYIFSGGQASEFIRTALQWLTGLAFFVPPSGRLNPVMWSLVVEIHFYLVLPLLFLLTKPLSARTCLWVIPLFLFAVPFSIEVTTGLAPSFSPKISDPFCVGLSCFCLGVAVAGIDALKLWDKRWARIGELGGPMLIAALAGMAWLAVRPPAHGNIAFYTVHWLYLIGSASLLCYAANPDHPHVRWLCTPWLRWCGIISYEWYLFHQPIIEWTRQLVGPAGGSYLKFGLVAAMALPASMIFSALVYRMYSLPILKYGRSQKTALKQ